MHHYHPTEAEDEHFEVYEQTLERMGELGY